MKRILRWFGLAVLILVGLLGPRVAPLAQVALWRMVGGPPLDMDRPHDGTVVVHIDVLGRFTTDISRIRITNTTDNTIVWDVTPLSPHSECWNHCWNLTLSTGSNPSTFTAGPQTFAPQTPATPTFALTAGTTYRFDVWDGNGRLASDRFRL